MKSDEGRNFDYMRKQKRKIREEELKYTNCLTCGKKTNNNQYCDRCNIHAETVGKGKLAEIIVTQLRRAKHAEKKNY